VTVPNLPRVRNPGRTRLIVAASVLGVALTCLLVLLVVRFASQRPDEVNLGKQEFEVGRADVFARAIDRDGPILFKDPLTSRPGREIYVQHLGDDEEEGWLALDAYAPGAPRKERCILRWEAEDEVFRDPCGNGEVPADGDVEGVRTYQGDVDDRGVVVIDLRTEASAGTGD
jgi:hypothetical protein